MIQTQNAKACYPLFRTFSEQLVHLVLAKNSKEKKRCLLVRKYSQIKIRLEDSFSHYNYFLFWNFESFMATCEEIFAML